VASTAEGHGNKKDMQIKLEKPVSFYPQLAKVFGGIREALYIQQLIYWSDKTKREDKFFYKTQEEFEEETTIPPRTQFTIRKKLEMVGILQTKRLKAHGIPTTHYKINESILQEYINGTRKNFQLEVEKISGSNRKKFPVPREVEKISSSITEREYKQRGASSQKQDQPTTNDGSKNISNSFSFHDGGEKLERAVAVWNSHTVLSPDLVGKIRNPNADPSKTRNARLLPQCRKITGDLIEKFKKNAKEYDDEEIEKAIENYVLEIVNRKPSQNSTYIEHRWSFYEFMQREYGFRSFVNK
jgi:hypothetical protein